MDAPIRPRRRTVAATTEGAVHASHSVGTSKSAAEGKPTSFSIPAEATPADPAYVSVGVGMTENLGNYESLRLDVRVTLPCGTSDAEVRAASARASSLATEFIEEERKKAFGSEGITA